MKDLLDHHSACSSTVVCIIRWNANLLPLWMTKMDCVGKKISNLWSDKKIPKTNVTVTWCSCKIFKKKCVSSLPMGGRKWIYGIIQRSKVSLWDSGDYSQTNLDKLADCPKLDLETSLQEVSSGRYD